MVGMLEVAPTSSAASTSAAATLDGIVLGRDLIHHRSYLAAGRAPGEITSTGTSDFKIVLERFSGDANGSAMENLTAVFLRERV